MHPIKSVKLRKYLCVFHLINKLLVLASASFNCGISFRLATSDDTKDEVINYSKLTLDKNKLKGSRWSLDKQKHKTIIVYHAFEVVEIVKVDTDGMSVRVEFHMRQRWQADGLEFPKGLFLPGDTADTFISADENVLDTVWSPDSFIPNARETKIHAVAAPQSIVSIYQNKTIVYKARMHSILGCAFTFEWYPLDMQICDLIFESYKYTNQVVNYTWEPYHPVVIDSDIILYQYNMILPPKLSTGEHERWGKNFKYPYVKVTFKFERKLGNNIIQVFVPTILVVILSWFSFWLGLDAVPGRISLLITCILTLVTMHSSLKGVIPPVHYVKMMDIWMVGCMSFVFGAICELIVVKYMKWRNDQRLKMKEEKEEYLKRNGVSRNLPLTHLPPPTIDANMHSMNGMPIPNTVYPPDYNSQHPYTQFYNNNQMDRNGRSQYLSNSAPHKQAWENGQQTMGLSPGPADHVSHRQRMMPNDYSVMLKMQEMAMYERAMAPPPAPTRPFWVKMDRVCRVLFPLLFFIFNAAFWPILFIGASKQYVHI